MDNFTKVLRLGTHRTWGGRPYSVYVKVEYEIKDKGGCLSLTGVEGPLPSGNCLGSAGQIILGEEDAKYLATMRCAPGWDEFSVAKLIAVWRRWHLNDFRAGCEHQRARGETWETHPLAQCPECGYKLGSAWLFEPLPEEVLTWLRGLPETDRQPAWV